MDTCFLAELNLLLKKSCPLAVLKMTSHRERGKQWQIFVTFWINLSNCSMGWGQWTLDVLNFLSSSVYFFPHDWCVVNIWNLWTKCYINICIRNNHVFCCCFILKWKNNRRRVYLILFYSNWVSCFLRWFCVHYSTSYLFYIWFYTS